jgi:hypothetical protein
MAPSGQRQGVAAVVATPIPPAPVERRPAPEPKPPHDRRNRLGKPIPPPPTEEMLAERVIPPPRSKRPPKVRPDRQQEMMFDEPPDSG